MKKLLYLLIALPLMAVQPPFGFFKVPIAPAAPCATLEQDNSGAYDTEFGTSYYNYRAGSFVTGLSGFSVCGMQLKLVRNNTLSGTLEVKIYTDVAGSPGTLVGSGSSTIDVMTVGTSEGYVTFSGMNATLSAATVYWVVLQASSSFNNIRWIGHTGAGSSKGSLDGTTWDFEGTADMDFKAYSE